MLLTVFVFQPHGLDIVVEHVVWVDNVTPSRISK